MTFVSHCKKLKSQGKQILNTSQMTHLFAFCTTFLPKEFLLFISFQGKCVAFSLTCYLLFVLKHCPSLCFENNDLKRLNVEREPIMCGKQLQMI